MPPDNDLEQERKIAFFSMEIALESDIPTYSGGLGILAGDILKSAADLEVPIIGVTLVYNNGYFYQMLDYDGVQRECDIQWVYSGEFERIEKMVKVQVNGEDVNIGAWRYDIIGHTGFIVPVYLLETNVEGNTQEQKDFTRLLYDATQFQRIIQEKILGIGGARMLNALGFDNIGTYHMNEGHSSFLVLELLKSAGGDMDKVRRLCTFTTHTPVRAGHDIFEYDLVDRVFREENREHLRKWAGPKDLNMTLFGMNSSGYINAVSEKHREVASEMFPQHAIDHITNGVHLLSWVHPELHNLYKKYLANINHDASLLGNAQTINSTELYQIHEKIKLELLDYEKSHSWVLLDEKLLTIGFARRITGYKRPALLLHDLDRLGKICKGKAQIVMAGKTHPKDWEGKELIKRIFSASKYLWEKYRVSLVFLNNYDIDLAKLLVSGVDLWLNTPKRYLEASGTSGMKAAMNGVPNFSVLDGWWIEGHRYSTGLAGWSIGPGPTDSTAQNRSDETDAEEIYDKLKNEIIPMYYQDKHAWITRMKHAISLGAHFNTHRVVRQYAEKAWKLKSQERWAQNDRE